MRASSLLLAAVCLVAAALSAQAAVQTTVIAAENTLAALPFSAAALWAPTNAASSTWAYFVCSANKLYKLPYEATVPTVLPGEFFAATEICDGAIAVSAAGVFFSNTLAGPLRKIADPSPASAAPGSSAGPTSTGPVTSLAADAAGSLYWTQSGTTGAFYSVANGAVYGAVVTISGVGTAGNAPSGVAVSAVVGTAASELILTNGAATTVQRVTFTAAQAAGAAADLTIATTGTVGATKITIATPSSAADVGFTAVLSSASNVWAAGFARAGTAAPTVTVVAADPTVAGATLTAAVWEAKYKLITLFSTTTGISKASSSAIAITAESRITTGALATTTSIVVKADRAILRATPTGNTPNVYTTGVISAGTATLAWAAGSDIALIVLTPDVAAVVSIPVVGSINIVPTATTSQFSFTGAATAIAVGTFTVQATGTPGAYRQITTPVIATPQAATAIWANDAGTVFFTQARTIQSVSAAGVVTEVCATVAGGTGNFVALTGISCVLPLCASTVLFAIDSSATPVIYRCVVGTGTAAWTQGGATVPAGTPFTGIATSQGASGFLFLATASAVYSVPLTGAATVATNAIVSANLMTAATTLSKVSFIASNRAGTMLYAAGAIAGPDTAQVVAITVTIPTGQAPTVATATAAYITGNVASFLPKYIVADWNDAANTVYAYGADNTLWSYAAARAQVGTLAFATPLMGLALRPSNSLYAIVSAGSTSTPITYVAAVVTKTATFAVAGSIVNGQAIIPTAAPASANPRWITLVDGVPTKVVGGLTSQAVTCTALAGVTAGAIAAVNFADGDVSSKLTTITGTATASGSIPCFATTATNPTGIDSFRFTAVAPTTATAATTFTVTAMLAAFVIPTTTTPFWNTLNAGSTNALTVELPYFSTPANSPVVLNAVCTGTGTSTGTIVEFTTTNCVIATTRSYLFTAGANAGVVTCVWTYTGPAAGLYAPIANTVFTIVAPAAPAVLLPVLLPVSPPALAAAQELQVGSSWYKLDFTVAALPAVTSTIYTECSRLGDDTVVAAITATATNFVAAAAVFTSTVTFTANAWTGNARCVFKVVTQADNVVNPNYAAITPAAFFIIVAKLPLAVTGVPAPGNAIVGGDITTRVARAATSVTILATQPAGIVGLSADNRVTLTLNCQSNLQAAAFTYTPVSKQIVLDSASATATNSVVVAWTALPATGRGMDVQCSWGFANVGTGTKFVTSLLPFTFFVGEAVALTATPAASTTTRRVGETSVVTVAAAGDAVAPIGGTTITATCAGVGYASTTATISGASIAAGSIVTGTWTFTAPASAMTTLTVTCTYTLSGTLANNGYFSVPAPTVFTVTPQAAVIPRGIPAAADVIVPMLTTIIASTTSVNVIVPKPAVTLAAGQTLIVGLTGCTANNVAAVSGADVTFNDATTVDATIAITIPAAVADTGIIVKCTFKALTGTAAPYFYSTLSTFQFVVAQRHLITAVNQNTGHYFAATEKTDILFTAPTTAGGVGTFSVDILTVCTPCVNTNNNLFTKTPVITNAARTLTNAARTATTSVAGAAPGTTVCSFTISGADSNLFTKPADVTIVTWPVAQITTTGAGITGALGAFTMTPVSRSTTSSVLTLAVPAGTPVNVADEYALLLTCTGSSGTVTAAPATAAPFLAGAALPAITISWTSTGATDAPLLVSCAWTASGSKTLRYMQPAAFSFIVGDPLTFTAAVTPGTAVVGATGVAIPIITLTPPAGQVAATTAQTGGVTISMSCTRTPVGTAVTNTFTYAAAAALGVTDTKTFSFPVDALSVGTFACTFSNVRNVLTVTDDRRFLAPTSTVTVTITTPAVTTVQLVSTGATIIADNGNLVYTVDTQAANYAGAAGAEGFSLVLNCGDLNSGVAKVFTSAALTSTFTIAFPALVPTASGRTYQCSYTISAATPAAKYLVPVAFTVRQGSPSSFTTVTDVATAAFGVATTFTATIKPVGACLPQGAIYGVTCTVPVGTATGDRPNVRFSGQAVVNNQLSATSVSIDGTSTVGTVTILLNTLTTTPIGAYVCTPTINSVAQNFYFNNPPAFTVNVVASPTFTLAYPATIAGNANNIVTVSVTEAPMLGGVWAKVTCGGITANARYFYFFETRTAVAAAQSFNMLTSNVQYATASCTVTAAGFAPATPIAAQWTETRFVSLAAQTQVWGIRPVITATAGVVEGVITVPACLATTITLSTTATAPNTVALSCTGSAGYATVTPATFDGFVTGTTATFTILGLGIGSSFTCTPAITGGAGNLYDTTAYPVFTAVVGTPTPFTATGNPAFTTTGTTRTVSVSLAALPSLVTSVDLQLVCTGAAVVPAAFRTFTGASTQTFAITATTAGTKTCTYSVVNTVPAGDAGRFRVPAAFSYIVGTLRTFTVTAAFTQLQIGTSNTATVIVAGAAVLQQAIVVGVACTNGVTVSPATATFATGAPVAATFTFTAPAAAGTSVCTVSSTSESVAPTATTTFNIAVITTPVDPSSSGSVDPCAGGICAAFAAASRPSVILYIAALLAAFVAARQ